VSRCSRSPPAPEPSPPSRRPACSWPARSWPAAGATLLIGGAEAFGGLDELEPGRLAAVLELVTAAEPAPPETALERPGARAAGASSAAPPDVVELLRKLGDLRDAGVLTDDEFAAKKAELLRRI
jgi:hypothetical protein